LYPYFLYIFCDLFILNISALVFAAYVSIGLIYILYILILLSIVIYRSIYQSFKYPAILFTLLACERTSPSSSIVGCYCALIVVFHNLLNNSLQFIASLYLIGSLVIIVCVFFDEYTHIKY